MWSHNNAHIRMTQMQERSESNSLHMHVNGVASNPTLSHAHTPEGNVPVKTYAVGVWFGRREAACKRENSHSLAKIPAVPFPKDWAFLFVL